MINTSIHKHQLVLYENIPIVWYCDMVSMERICAGKHDRIFIYRDSKCFYCDECQFFLCEPDGNLYNLEKKYYFLQLI